MFVNVDTQHMLNSWKVWTPFLVSRTLDHAQQCQINTVKSDYELIQWIISISSKGEFCECVLAGSATHKWWDQGEVLQILQGWKQQMMRRYWKTVL